MKPTLALRSFLLGSAIFAALPMAHADTYTWADTNVNNTTPKTLDWFSGGSNPQATWNTTPGVQGSSLITNADTIQFFTNSTTSLPNTVTAVLNSNINNGGTAVQLGILTLTGRASNTNTRTLTVNIGGNALNFSAATGIINLDANNQSTSRNLVYNVNSNIQLGTASSAGALTIQGSGTSAFNFGGIISELQAGGGSLIKSGSSTVTLSNTASSFTGNILVSNGTLSATGGANVLNPTTSALGNPQTGSRTITIGTGGTLNLGANDVLGNIDTTVVATLVANGGIITSNKFNTLGPVQLNGGTLSSFGGAFAGYPSFFLNGTVTVGGSAVSTISSTGANSEMVLRTAGTTFDVADAVSGSGSDLNVTGVLANGAGIPAANGALIKTGVGTMTLSGTNTYTGDTTVSDGTLTLAAGARLTFRPAANGVSNKVTGTGAATFGGTFSILTAAADLTTGNSWNLVDVAALTETFGAGFAVSGFSPQPDGLTWVKTVGEQTWTFSETTGNLTLVETVTPFEQWMTQFTTIPAGQTGLNDDPDGDGATNQFEFAFAGDPAQGAAKGLWAQHLQDTGGPATKELTLVVATLDGVTFTSTAGGTQTGLAADLGFSYVIEGSLDLAFPNSDVSHVGVSDTAPVETGLPSLAGTGWEYHTFRLDASEGLPDKGFLRAHMNTTTVTFESLLAEMTDYDSVARWPAPDYTTSQASSYDRASTNPAVQTDANWFANRDYENFLRGDVKGSETEWVMMDATGPGCVTRIWFGGNDTPTQRPGKLRIYLDDNPVPVIDEQMLGLLNGAGSVPPPFATELSRGHNMFLPIPYAQSCRIVYVGTGAETSNPTLFWYNIETRTYQPGSMVRSFVAGEPAAKAALVAATGAMLVAPPARTAAQNLTLAQTIPAGSEITLDLPAGAAAVTGMRVKVTAANLEQALRSTILKGSFDGTETIWCPLGDFAGSGVGLNALSSWYRSITTADGWMTNRWTMPYASSGQFKVENLGTQPVTVTLEAGISAWQWDDLSMHFHANWHSQHLIPTNPRRDFNFLTATGQGVYLGDTLAVFNTPGIGNPWWGEGDEKIWVDNGAFPAHFGTGTEDYYCYAWGSTVPFQSPFANQTRASSGNLGNTSLTRTRNLDRIPFRTGLQFDMEIWHWISNITVDFAATTYWYAKPGVTHNRAPEPAEAGMSIK